MFLFLTLNIFNTLSRASIVDFEQVNVSRDNILFRIWVAAQSLFACSKPTMERPKQCVKSVQS